MLNVVDLIEPALSLARELLSSLGGNDDSGQREALAVMRAVRDCVELHRPPAYTEYSLDRVVESIARTSGREKAASAQLDGRMCIGDPVQIQVLVRALLASAVLEHDGELEWDVDLDGDVPCFALSIDGPGRFPESVDFGFGVTLPFSTAEEQWTIGTRGGRIDRALSRLSLRLKGIRVIPRERLDLERVCVPVYAAEEKLRMLAGGESGLLREQVIRDVLDALGSALSYIDESRKAKEPSDLRALIADAMDEVKEDFGERRIGSDVTVADDIPPIVLRRSHVASSVANAGRLAVASLPQGGAFTLIADYHPAKRCVEIMCAISGKPFLETRSPYPASIRRAIEEIHGGRFEVLEDPDGVTIQLELSDPVGKTLDAWIPGFDSFSARSKQMLRLLKSGGPAPPEDFILAGVLEEELERWLLPRLSVAPATTLAHELTGEKSPLAGSVADRRSKALSQIARGRPKKEVCQPAYAAEVLWAFRHDERHRKAVASHRLSESVLKSLCEELLKTAIDYTFALRIVASAIA
ncbi:MAG: hypothetical protein WC655_23520 [Candidatus Hydrogenedentales bacterium]